jgi:hypothetical protein
MRRDVGRAWNNAQTERAYAPRPDRVPLVVALFVCCVLAPLAGVGAYHVIAAAWEMMP